HRHTPEIEQEISGIIKKEVTVNFTPHLLPVNRGILTTIYAPLKIKDITEEDVVRLYKRQYRKEPFVRVFEETLPDIRNVRGTNYCDIAVRINKRTSTLIVVSVIDNLLKGASGQAVQNMNLMLGLEETRGLTHLSALP
ncbi:MAG: N-acetyl-gamma-glutamyl-phosphate reductase, partial [Nitrospirae bacterium]